MRFSWDFVYFRAYALLLRLCTFYAHSYFFYETQISSYFTPSALTPWAHFAPIFGRSYALRFAPCAQLLWNRPQSARRKNEGRKAQISRKMFYETEFGAKSSWAQINSHFAPGVERKYVYEIDPWSQIWSLLI